MMRVPIFTSTGIMQLLYVPLDERPCNVYYPQMIAALQPQMQLRVPPLELLSQKKQAAVIDQLWDWVIEQATLCQTALLSIEMLVYGGLLPSRLHHDSVEILVERLQRLKKLKHLYPALDIFASNLIMRTPAYSSAEEEPDYYGVYGEQIFWWGWLQDKRERMGLTAAEQTQWEQIQQDLPMQHLTDYRDRRTCNVEVNLATLTLVEQGIISFLAIPQDDSAPYGFTAMDQRRIVSHVLSRRLQRQVHLYPGADEAGCTLLARAYNQHLGHSPRLYILHSAVGTEQIVPLYEDRPLGESLKAHVLAAGAQIVSTPDAADAVLAINSAGQVMQEAWNQATKDITYTSFRNLRFFVAEIERLVKQGRWVAIADIAFANGGETELVEMLDDAALWDNLLAYAGWNTCCNTLGTVLATLSLGLESDRPQAITFNKMYRLLEDWAYQAIVRQETIQTVLPQLGASYYDFNGQEAVITQTIAQQLRAVWQQYLRQSFTQWQIQQLAVSTPWHRMFEIGLELKIASQDSSQSPSPHG